MPLVLRRLLPGGLGWLAHAISNTDVEAHNLFNWRTR